MSGIDARIEKGVLVLRIQLRVEFEERGSEGALLAAKRKLTGRQSEVFDRLLRGWSDKEISLEMNISVSAVKHHVSPLLLKLGCADRMELLRKFGFKD